MSCVHRFSFLHRDDEFLLFPDWEVVYLFIGTFNPKWDNPNGNNAEYFYGRSRYFWRMLSIFFTGRDSPPNTKEEKIRFARQYQIGFTDIIREVRNVQINSVVDRKRIFSFRDSDLELFGENLVLNTESIKTYLTLHNPKKVLFTLLSSNPNTSISEQIAEIEQHAISLRIETSRLHSPTGQGLGKGTPRVNKLVHRWNSVNILPQVNLNYYPYTV